MEWKINWKRKLTSRKFWLAVAGFVGPLMLAFGASEAVASQVTALIMAGAAVVAYIIGEGLADAQHVEPEVVVMKGSEVETLEELAERK